MNPPAHHPRPRRRRWFHPQWADLLLLFAAYGILKGSWGASTANSGALIYGGFSALPLWLTMRTETIRNRRNGGGGRS